MPHVASSSGCFRFGVFEVDVRNGELTRQGKRLSLQEQPFRLLVMLIERPGELVSREEVRQRLWPQTIVDFDHGLNKAISKIRDALGDSAENPRFIQTVARRGYRFLADVMVAGDGEVETALPETASRENASVDSQTPVDPAPAKPRSRRTAAWAIAAAALLLLSA